LPNKAFGGQLASASSTSWFGWCGQFAGLHDQLGDLRRRQAFVAQFEDQIRRPVQVMDSAPVRRVDDKPSSTSSIPGPSLYSSQSCMTRSHPIAGGLRRPMATGPLDSDRVEKSSDRHWLRRPVQDSDQAPHGDHADREFADGS
jgi:hypothetical protein